MKKILLTSAFLATVALTFAAGSKHKKDGGNDLDIKMNIHIAKDGSVSISGASDPVKGIQQWVNEHSKDINVHIDDDTKKKDKDIKISLTIKEK